MQGGKLIDVQAWLRMLQKETKKPSDLQMSILKRAFARCELEAREIRSSTINESSQEPLREMIQGLPGAGKSELIHWVCRGTWSAVCENCFTKLHGFSDRRLHESFMGRCSCDFRPMEQMADHELEYTTSVTSIRKESASSMDSHGRRKHDQR